MIRILHFSPVRKPPEILNLHLEGLKNLKQSNMDLTYSFFDDNTDVESSRLLKDFIHSVRKGFDLKLELEAPLKQNNNERWSKSSYCRIEAIKNAAIDYFLNEEDYDYLFLTDSDLLLHPFTLEKLLDNKKDFCSNIFWTHFEGSPTYMPNAWYAKFQAYTVEDLKALRKKGIFPVDYTGACTLLSRKILERGVSFKKIPSLHYLGEDKHFCVRASVHGFQPYVDTNHPAFHLYNDSLVDQGKVLLGNGFQQSYLEEWLDNDWERKVERWLHPPQKSFFKKIMFKLLSLNG